MYQPRIYRVKTLSDTNKRYWATVLIYSGFYEDVYHNGSTRHKFNICIVIPIKQIKYSIKQILGFLCIHLSITHFFFDGINIFLRIIC